jgi:hypothetical protein
MALRTYISFMKPAFEENRPRNLGSGTTNELQDLRTTLGARHKRKPSLLPAVRCQALVSRAHSAAMVGRRSHDVRFGGGWMGSGQRQWWKVMAASTAGRGDGGVGTAPGRARGETK